MLLLLRLTDYRGFLKYIGDVFEREELSTGHRIWDSAAGESITIYSCMVYRRYRIEGGWGSFEEITEEIFGKVLKLVEMVSNAIAVGTG